MALSKNQESRQELINLSRMAAEKITREVTEALQKDDLIKNDFLTKHDSWRVLYSKLITMFEDVLSSFKSTNSIATTVQCLVSAVSMMATLFAPPVGQAAGKIVSGATSLAVKAYTYSENKQNQQKIKEIVDKAQEMTSELLQSAGQQFTSNQYLFQVFEAVKSDPFFAPLYKGEYFELSDKEINEFTKKYPVLLNPKVKLQLKKYQDVMSQGLYNVKKGFNMISSWIPVSGISITGAADIGIGIAQLFVSESTAETLNYISVFLNINNIINNIFNNQTGTVVKDLECTLQMMKEDFEQLCEIRSLAEGFPTATCPKTMSSPDFNSLGQMVLESVNMIANSYNDPEYCRAC